MWAHLRVLEPIGRGAFGVVYRAWDTRLDREVALKLQPDEPGAGGATRRSRKAGRWRASGIRTWSPSTAPSGSGRTSACGWSSSADARCSRALAQGGTFEPPPSPPSASSWRRALGAVHDAGLVHGDIKAQNVMLADDGRVVLMDFGAGRDLARRPQAAFRRHADVPGAGGASRRLALGVERHLRAGRGPLPPAHWTFPVPATDLHELRRAHDQGDSTDIRSLRPDLGRRLAAVVDPGNPSRPRSTPRHRRRSGARSRSRDATPDGRRRPWSPRWSPCGVGGSRARRVDPRPAEPDRGALLASGGTVDARQRYWRTARDRRAAVHEPRPRRRDRADRRRAHRRDSPPARHHRRPARQVVGLVGRDARPPARRGARPARRDAGAPGTGALGRRPRAPQRRSS